MKKDFVRCAFVFPAMLAFVGLAVLTSCRSGASEESNNKSLDNMARGASEKLTANSCSGSNVMSDDDFNKLRDSANITVEDGSLVADLRAALSAVPKSLQRMYFGMGYKFVVSARARTLCPELKAKATGLMAQDLSEADGAVSMVACWDRKVYRHDNDQLVEVTPQEVAAAKGQMKFTEEITAYVNADKATIAHATLRTIAYAVSQRFAFLHNENGTLAIDESSESRAFAAAKKELAVRALAAVAGKSDAFAAYRSLLPKSPAEMKADTAASDWTAWAASNADAARRFEDAVFAESLDSYYCSAATKSKLAQQFSEVHAYMSQTVGPDLESMSDVDAKTSLSLTCGSGLFPNLCAFGGDGCGLFGRLCQSRDSNGVGPGLFGGCGLFGRLCGGGLGSGCGLFGWRCD